MSTEQRDTTQGPVIDGTRSTRPAIDGHPERESSRDEIGKERNSAADAATLFERLKRSTEGGQWDEVPAGFEARDWTTVQHDDPFVRLSLDRHALLSFTPEIVAARAGALAAFWERKIKAARSYGGSAAIDELKRRFGGGVETYPERIAQAATALATPDLMAAASARSRSRACDALAGMLHRTLLDRVFAPNEATAIFDAGRTFGLSEGETAAYISEFLESQAYRCIAGTPGGAPSRAWFQDAWSAAPTHARIPYQPGAFRDRIRRPVGAADARSPRPGGAIPPRTRPAAMLVLLFVAAAVTALSITFIQRQRTAATPLPIRYAPANTSQLWRDCIPFYEPIEIVASGYVTNLRRRTRADSTPLLRVPVGDGYEKVGPDGTHRGDIEPGFDTIIPDDDHYLAFIGRVTTQNGVPISEPFLIGSGQTLDPATLGAGCLQVGVNRNPNLGGVTGGFEYSFHPVRAAGAPAAASNPTPETASSPSNLTGPERLAAAAVPEVPTPPSATARETPNADMTSSTAGRRQLLVGQ